MEIRVYHALLGHWQIKSSTTDRPRLGRNLQFMVQFFKEYTFENIIAKQAVSQLEDNAILKAEFMKQPVSQIPWGHNILLMQKVKEKKNRLWYMEQAIFIT